MFRWGFRASGLQDMQQPLCESELRDSFPFPYALIQQQAQGCVLLDKKEKDTCLEARAALIKVELVQPGT